MIRRGLMRVPLRWMLRRTLCTSARQPSSLSLPTQNTGGQRLYPKIEDAVMSKLHLENRSKFRVGLASITGAATLIVFLAWDDIKTLLAGQTADIAARSLDDSEIRENASVFAKAVIHEVLADPRVLEQAKVFVHDLILEGTTAEALTALVVQTLKSPATLGQVQTLLFELIKDPITQRKLIDLVIVAIQDEATLGALLQLLHRLFRDPSAQASIIVLLKALLADDEIRVAASEAGAVVVHQVLDDKNVEEHAKAWAAQVLSDDVLQKQGGDALWNAIAYSVTPGFLRSGKKKTPPPEAEEPPSSEVGAAGEQAVADTAAIAQVADVGNAGVPEPFKFTDLPPGDTSGDVHE